MKSKSYVSTSVLALVCALTGACKSSTTTTTDMGTAVDAGTDSGTQTDAAMTADLGMDMNVAADMGTTTDLGMDTDLGVDLGVDMATPPPPISIIGTSPSGRTFHVSRNVHVRFVIDPGEVFDRRTLTAQSANGPCTGSVQLSTTSDFTSCVAGTTNSSAFTGEFIPAQPLALGQIYILRVLGSVGALSGATLGDDFTMSDFFVVEHHDGEKAIFLTDVQYNGNLGGISGADAKCNADNAGMLDNGRSPTYKAFIVGTERTACSVSNCMGGSSVDWVLAPNTNYVRPDGSDIFATNSLSLPVGPFTNIVAGTVNFYDGFTSTDWTTATADTCMDWTSSDGGQPAAVGWGAAVNDTFITGGTVGCGTLESLLCVEQ